MKFDLIWIDELETLIDEHLEKKWNLQDLQEIYLYPINEKNYPFYSASAQRLFAMNGVVQS